MKVSPGKILPLFTLIFSAGVLSAAGWVLLESWTWREDCSETEQGLKNESCIVENVRRTWTRSEKLTLVLQASCGGSAIGTFLQVFVCTVLLCTTVKKLQSRLKAWHVFTCIAILIQLTSCALPFTVDPDTDSFLGIKTFVEETGERVKNLKNLFSDDVDFDSWIEFLLEDFFNVYFILLCSNIVLSLVFLIITMFCLCCCCCCCDGGSQSEGGNFKRGLKLNVKDDEDQLHPKMVGW